MTTMKEAVEQHFSNVDALDDSSTLILELWRRLEVAEKALQYVRHRDARWHDEDVVTPALAAIRADYHSKDASPAPFEVDEQSTTILEDRG